mmetsp:Transcript_56914/g.133523  ORF Transcript_56914/g.133523 Transcript_56914/m.133523 type:complete len:183 (-) Transcript_56914:269-817(-)
MDLDSGLTWAEATAMAGCNFLRSVLSDMGDVVCCLSGVGLPRILPDGPDSVTGSIDLTRPPAACEMLPSLSSARHGWRRGRAQLQESLETGPLEGLFRESPLAVFRAVPWRSVERDPVPPAEKDLEEDVEDIDIEMVSSEDVFAGPCEVIEEPVLSKIYINDDGVIQSASGKADATAAWYLV